ncbi:MAG: hypothetical protein GX897_10515 [Clostridiales bacterium]|nr:hypothetical protein [Clostridiales bacterium]
MDKIKTGYENFKNAFNEKVESDQLMLRNSYKFDLALVRRNNPDDKIIAFYANSEEKELPLLKVAAIAASISLAILLWIKIGELVFNIRYKNRFRR